MASRDPPSLILLSTNAQGSLVPGKPTLKEVRVRERGRGQPMNDLVVRNNGLLTTKQKLKKEIWTVPGSGERFDG